MMNFIHKTSSRFVVTVALVAAVFSSARLRAQETDYKAYTLFLYNFMKYIEWPEEQSKGDFVVAVIGDSPISKELQMLVASKKLKGRNIVLKKISSPDEYVNCHLLFVPGNKSSLVREIRDQTKDKPVLIVGEREGLAKKGASISFVTLDEDELKFDVSKKDIEQHMLKISLQLLNLGIQIN